MSTYRVEYDPRAVKELKKLDRSVARAVHAAVLALAEDPRPVGCRRLVGVPGWWRIKVRRDWRVIYEIQDDRLLVIAVHIGHRGEVYRQL